MKLRFLKSQCQDERESLELLDVHKRPESPLKLAKQIGLNLVTIDDQNEIERASYGLASRGTRVRGLLSQVWRKTIEEEKELERSRLTDLNKD